jgi:uncharacterized protein
VRRDDAPAVVPTGGVLEVGVVLTHACNLACVYCYTGDKKRVRMSDAVADATLDFAFRTAAERGSRLQLGFFGGEPLLERALLLDLATRARARAEAEAIGLTLQVTTNGTLLSPALVQQLGARKVHVALSIDGTRAQHEAGRPLAGGGSSWEATYAGLQQLVAARDRFPFDVIAVIDPCNVGMLADGVMELVDGGVESLTLNMNWGAPWDEAASSELEDQLERVAAVFLAALRDGRWIRIEPLVSALRSQLQLGHVVTAGCAPGGRRLAVAPSGRLYGCARAVGEDDGRAAIGHVDHGLSVAPSDPEPGCSCANAEETGHPAIAGQTRIRHDRAIASITGRLAARLGEEFTRILITEQGPTP